MMRRNLGYKLLALGIAVVIWAYASIGQNPRGSRELKRVPLQISRVEPGYVVTSTPQTVNVVLEGARSHVNSVAAELDSVAPYVSLRGKTAGRHTVPVAIRLPDGFAGLVNATPVPQRVSVTLEEKAQRMLTIGVQFTGSPPVGYRLGTPQLSPSRAVVSGRAKLVNRVAQLVVGVKADDPRPENLEGDFSVTALDKDGGQVQGVELTPERVHLSLKLLEAPASRAVFVSLDTDGQPPFPYKVEGIDVHPQTVTVTGRPEQLMSVTTLRTEPVHLTDRTKSFSQRVGLVLPPGLRLAETSQVRITVRIGTTAPPVSESSPSHAPVTPDNP